MNILQLAWRNILDKPLRALLSVVLFALGTGLIALFLLLQSQIQSQFDKNEAGINLVIGAKGSKLQLILNSMYHVDAPTGNVPLKDLKRYINIKANHPYFEMGVPLALGDSHEGYRIVGTTEKILDLYKAEVGEGRWLEAVSEVVIGARVADELGLFIDDEFQSSHGFAQDSAQVHDHSDALRIVGILAPTGSVLDQLILTDVQTYWHVHEKPAKAAPNSPTKADEHQHDEHDHAGHDHVHHDHAPAKIGVAGLLAAPDTTELTSLLLILKNPNIAPNIIRGIDENTDMMAVLPSLETDELMDNLGLGIETLSWLAYIIVFVSSLSVFIALFSALRERKKELALLRVMGASREKIFGLITLEGLLLAIIGACIGLIISHLGIEFLSGYAKESYRYALTGKVFLKEEMWLILGALLAGFLAAIIPAWQASRADISDTMAN